MVRRCVIEDCNETDKTILSHRFPKTHETAEKWKSLLGLKLSVDELQKKFVVCTRHFCESAYRNEVSNCLNTTAMPNLMENEGNQRIIMTAPDMKRKGAMPVRCHAAIGKAEFIPQATLKNTAIKRIKLEPEKIVHSIELLEEHDEGDTSTCEAIETDIIVPPAHQDPPGELNYKLSYEAPAPIIQCHQETQTDKSVPESSQKIEVVERFVESKDDKMIEILYPEFKDVSKITLIEMINDRDQKVAGYEEKIKKLELAMRNLL